MLQLYSLLCGLNQGALDNAVLENSSPHPPVLGLGLRHTAGGDQGKQGEDHLVYAFTSAT